MARQWGAIRAWLRWRFHFFFMAVLPDGKLACMTYYGLNPAAILLSRYGTFSSVFAVFIL
jgi:hypothetical protein